MSSTLERVSPRLISGFRDLSQQDAILKWNILQRLIRVFELAGFDPFESATVQLETVLFGADAYTDMAYFRAWNSRKRMTAESEPMALRFDLTVPLGRFVAAELANLPRPFARWQVGQVFRGEKPSAGRYCEFTQFDADILFAPSVVSDAQIVTLIYNSMIALGIRDFKVKLNNRKILNGLPALIGFSSKDLTSVLQILDKRDKESEASIREMLVKAVDTDGVSLGFTPDKIDALISFTNLGGSNQSRLSSAQVLMTGIQVGQDGVRELQEILSLIKASGVPEGVVEVDFSMVRGLGYYTGPIFETVLTDGLATELGIGAVFSGGRYDNLVERYTDVRVPATGASVGLDRLLVYAKAANLLDVPKTTTQVLVAYQPDTLNFAVEVAENLRRAGFRTRLYDGDDLAFRHQIGYANLTGIPWVAIVGGREAAKGKFNLKELPTRTQNEFTIREAIDWLGTR